jgi:hypothetical protein
VIGRAQRDDALLGVQEVELAEVLDHLALDGALEGEVEFLQRLAGREPRLADARLAAVAVARGHLSGQQQLREVLIAPLLGPGALGRLGQRPRRGGRLERTEQMRELGGRAHAIGAS